MCQLKQKRKIKFMELLKLTTNEMNYWNKVIYSQLFFLDWIIVKKKLIIECSMTLKR